jgi:hypothetical protein
MRADIELLVADTAAHDARLRVIQQRPMDVVGVVDTDGRRVPPHLRNRLTSPRTGVSAPAGQPTGALYVWYGVLAAMPEAATGTASS